ncbi:cupin domain-containing protein [Dongia sp. agr-C8]
MSVEQRFEPALDPARSAWPIAAAALIGLTVLIGGRAVTGAMRPPLRHTVEMSGAQSNAMARPRAVQHPIACEKLPNVPGKSITTLLVEFTPNAFTPRHRHPGSVTAYVTKGTLRSQLNDGPVGSFGIGGTWFEPPGTIHSMVENPSPTDTAEIMAIFVADSDCGALTIFDD